MTAFFQWALGAGFYRFLGVVALLAIGGGIVAEILNAFARVVAAFRRTL